MVHLLLSHVSAKTGIVLASQAENLLKQPPMISPTDYNNRIETNHFNVNLKLNQRAMKYFIVLGLVFSAMLSQAQSIVGTWQMTDEKTCFQSALSETMNQSETEKELSSQMGSSSASSVAKLIRFDAKGKGEEGIFKTGKKKGSSMNPFTYQIRGSELQFLDKKSGMITERYIIEELSETTLRFHDAKKECEIKAFTKAR
jgi:hypothetical protein